MKKTAIGIYRVIKVFSDRLRANHVDVYSASAAYYLFISSVPMILALFAVVPFTPLTEEIVVKAVEHILPSRFDEFAVSMINETYENHFTILSISAIAAIWSAARGLMSIRRGFDEIFHIMEPYNYVIIRLKSAFYTLIMIIIMALELMFGAFGQSIIRLIDRYYPGLAITSSIGQFYTNLAFVVGAFIVLLLLYCFLPRKKQKIKSQLPGAVVATLAMSGFSMLFSLFLNYTMDSFSMYGSLATVVILLLWLYVNMYIMFVGAQINSVFADRLFFLRKIKGFKENVSDLEVEAIIKAIEDDRNRPPMSQEDGNAKDNEDRFMNIISFKKLYERREKNREISAKK
ncbi:MAG: YihY/virulence factor BrkB family protein [Lachnospiraceae bacterium]|nr:YihY/virulence factor BrkB family protein [Lachnospiraceae bacterium]